MNAKQPVEATEAEAAKDDAIVAYRAARTRWLEAMAREDESFARYFRKRSQGVVTNGAALSRLMNATSDASVELHSAQSDLYRLDLDPHMYDDADGVERTPLGAS